MTNPGPNIFNLVALKAAGADDDLLRSKCREDGIPEEEIPAILAEVSTKLLAAADVDRNRELGTAIIRTDTIFRKAMIEGDNKTALAAQRELNKLLGLYQDGEKAGTGDGEDVTNAADAVEALRAVRGHLLPLGLASAEYPIQEHARIAAAELWEIRDGASEKTEG